jgi:hypothetical protein
MLLTLFLASSAAAHYCAPPAVCNQPPADFVRLVSVRPRVQWNTNGGFCGAFSLQTMMMAHGAWVSEDLIRKANIGSPCFGHGNGPNSAVCTSTNDTQCISTAPEGCEVGPENYEQTCSGLRLVCDVWDYTQPKPQASAFKAWLKSHLVQGVPVVWVPMLKGASNTPYGNRSCPGGGHFNHHEPVLGIGSNRSLSDPTVSDDDWMVHLSNEDEDELVTYYRTFGSLEDSLAMSGNCLRSEPRHSCAYPCFFEEVTYGIAVRGFARSGASISTKIDVDIVAEPNPRAGEKPVPMYATVEVRELTPGGAYTLYSYRGLNSFPASGVAGYDAKLDFAATSDMWSYRDPTPFLSNDAVYYVAVERAVLNSTRQ